MLADWYVDQQDAEQVLPQVMAEYGFAIVLNALNRPQIDELYSELDGHFHAAPFSAGLFYGNHTKRFGGVLKRSAAAQSLAMHPSALYAAQALLGPHCEGIQLNLTQGIEIFPGSFAQVPHRDQDIWLGTQQTSEMMINAMWALDDFTRENGATVIWPGSHRDRETILPDQPGIIAEMPAGSLCLFLGSTIHGGGANWSSTSRRGLVISYCLGWLKPCENPWLTYPPDTARSFTPELAELIGYSMHTPSLNHVDGCCPSALLKAPKAKRIYTESLHPEHCMAIKQYNALQARELVAA